MSKEVYLTLRGHYAYSFTMMTIPDNYPLELAPLAWLDGHWQGWGMIASASHKDSSSTTTKDTHVLHEVRSSVVGQQMRLVTTIFEASIAEHDLSLPTTATAQEGLNVLKAGDVLREETIYFHVLPSEEKLPPPGEFQQRGLHGNGCDELGLSILWVGALVGPRIQLAADVITRSSSAPNIDRLTRMYGLVGGELMWAQEYWPCQEDVPKNVHVPAEHVDEEDESRPDISGRLMRVEGE